MSPTEPGLAAECRLVEPGGLAAERRLAEPGLAAECRLAEPGLAAERRLVEPGGLAAERRPVKPGIFEQHAGEVVIVARPVDRSLRLEVCADDPHDRLAYFAVVLTDPLVHLFFDACRLRRCGC